MRGQRDDWQVGGAWGGRPCSMKTDPPIIHNYSFFLSTQTCAPLSRHTHFGYKDYRNRDYSQNVGHNGTFTRKLFLECCKKKLF